MTAPNRRRFQWSLRTLFVMVTVFCVWLGYELNWMNDRAKVLRWLDQFPPAAGERPMYYVADDIRSKPASISLLVLGDRTIRILHIPFGDESTMELAEVRLRKARQLFPEAEASLLYRPKPGLAGNAGALWEPLERLPATP